MKVLNHTEKSKGFNSKHRKESLFFRQYTVIAMVDNELKEVITARLYGKNTIYACIWIKGISIEHFSGSGSASGGGYHLESAAMSDAIINAGFELSESIDGVGSAAIERALLAIAEYNGFSGAKIFIAQG